MYGKMLKQIGHATIVYCVMMTMMVAMVGWAVYWDTISPNPGIINRAALAYSDGRPYQIETQNAEKGQSLRFRSISRQTSVSRWIRSWETRRQRVADIWNFGRGLVRLLHDRDRLRVGELHAR